MASSSSYVPSARHQLIGCKKVCGDYRANKPVTGGRYAAGQKRCDTCEIFIKWDGIWCPCCGYKLRHQSRSHKYRKIPGTSYIA